MEKLGRKLLLVFAALVLASAPALATTITFSELGLVPGNSLTTEYASLGILVSTVNGPATIGGGATPPVGSTITGQYLVVNWSPNGVAHVNIEFVDPTNSAVPGWVDGSTVFFDLWDDNAVPSPRVTVNAYDLSNVLLGSYDLTSEYANNAGGFTGQIHRLELVDNGGDGHLFDNLDFGAITTPQEGIPEPGTFFLMGAGLVGLGFAIRRKRA